MATRESSRRETHADSSEADWDVLIVGGGLAGLTLARQLLLASDKRVLLVDRKPLPPAKQKVGEATVQMSAYYYSRVLELEEYLLREHFLKYNLRFYWQGNGPADRYEGYDQSYIRTLSNIATYQLDRNKIEAELLRRNRDNPRCSIHAPVAALDIQLSESGPHSFRFRGAEGEVAGRATWVVDASGRGKVLAKKLGLAEPGAIRHGTSFAWVEGLVDIEKLTPLSAREVRLRRDRSALGHLPAFLATNHFCGEGLWFWVIPLHGITSLGLVYDRSVVSFSEVNSAEKLIAWVCQRFPLFARDLPQRRVLHHSGYNDFAYDCAQTLSASRWALCGEACRFADPLYSPGGDLISAYNTLITDAILTEDRQELAGKVRLYDQLARALYEAYVPSFAVSYEVLGDQEVFSLRYIWELSVYFAFYVFPFINDLFTAREFVPAFLRHFSRLGPINRSLHAFLVGFYRWKKAGNEMASERVAEPVHFDFMSSGHLRATESCFYRVGLSAAEGKEVLGEQLANLEELARWIVAHVAWAVTRDERAFSRDFVTALDPASIAFDSEDLAARVGRCAPGSPPYAWSVPVPAASWSGQTGHSGWSGSIGPQLPAQGAAGLEAAAEGDDRRSAESAPATPGAPAAPGREVTRLRRPAQRQPKRREKAGGRGDLA